MHDAERLIRGLGFYVQDAAPAGALHVAYVRSDHAHAQVLGVDATDALGLAGVVAVWQASDVAGVPTTAACPDFIYVPTEHARAVQPLFDAGKHWTKEGMKTCGCI